MVATGLLLASFAALVCANPVAHNLVVHERRDSAPEGFVHNGPAPESQSLNLRIALVSKDMAGLEKALYDVSTPGNELYGQHLSKEEVCPAFCCPRSAVHPSLRSRPLLRLPQRASLLSKIGSQLTTSHPPQSLLPGTGSESQYQSRRRISS